MRCGPRPRPSRYPGRARGALRPAPRPAPRPSLAAAGGAAAAPRARASRGSCASGGAEAQDVAIAAATALPWWRLQPFVASFRHFAPCAVLVLFLGEVVDEELATQLDLHQVRQVRLSGSWPFLVVSDLGGLKREVLEELVPRAAGVSPSATGRDKPQTPGNAGLVTLRFFAADSWLAARETSGELLDGLGLVLLVDSVDVIFQGDPFGSLADPLREDPAQAWLFEEHPERRLRSCPFNWPGLRPFGPAARRRLRNNTVVNSGVVLGGRWGVRRLIRAMRAVVRRYAPLALNDQALLNALAGGALLALGELGPPPRLRVLPHGSGPVRNVGIEVLSTMGYHNLSSVRLGLGAEGWPQVLGEGDVPVPVVHQYDRRDMLRLILVERWQRNPELPIIWRPIFQKLSLTTLEDVQRQVYEPSADFFMSRPCPPGTVNCCRQRFLWRKPSFDTMSGRFLANPLDTLDAIEHCVTMGATESLAFSFDVGGLLAKAEAGGPEERQELRFARRLWPRRPRVCPRWREGGKSCCTGFAQCPVPEGVDVDEPCGSAPCRARLQLPGARFCGVAWQACLDAACGPQATAKERGDVLWELARGWVEGCFQHWGLLRVAASLRRIEPRPGELWVRRLSAVPAPAAGLGPAASAGAGREANRSAEAFARLRVRPLA